MAVRAALTLQGVHCAVVQIAAANVASVDQLIQYFLQAAAHQRVQCETLCADHTDRSLSCRQRCQLMTACTAHLPVSPTPMAAAPGAAEAPQTSTAARAS